MTDPRTNVHYTSSPHLARALEILNGRIGYQIAMPGVVLTADVDITYDTASHQWTAVQTDDSHRWEAIGATTTEAYLNLIAVRCGEPDPGPVIAAARTWYADRKTGDGLATERALEAALATYLTTDPEG